MSDRFFHETSLELGPATLDGPEAHHLIHVLRAKPGLEVILFDGSGDEFAARVEQVERAAVRLAVYERREEDRESATTIALGVALPKGDRPRWLVEKCTELGVAELIPLETVRGEAQPGAGALEKLRRAVIEASKQCGRNRLMEIRAPQAWDEFITARALMPGSRWIAHPGGTTLAKALTSEVIASSSPRAFHLAIGPEGGLTEQEIRGGTNSGWHIIGLGRRLLRVETAAIALAAVVGLS
jgi:16S rRNA (uracil1498-N3)-methyltransferase